MIKDMLTRVMTEYGAMRQGWRLVVTGREGNGSSDWTTVHFSIFKPRCRKPCTLWSMRINVVTGYIDWDRTEHVRV